MKTVIRVMLDILDYLVLGMFRALLGIAWTFAVSVPPAMAVMALVSGESGEFPLTFIYVYLCVYAFAIVAAAWWTIRHAVRREWRKVKSDLWAYPAVCSGWPIVLGVAAIGIFSFGCSYLLDKLYNWSHSK